MKKIYSVVLPLVVFALFACNQVAFAVPAVSGAWKGTIMQASYTACSGLPVVMTLTQCSTGSYVVRGTFKLGNTTIPIVGKFRLDGVTLDISGTVQTTASLTSLTIVAVFVPSTGKIQITDMDNMITSFTTGQGSPYTYDLCSLSK
ncbi:MAG: hypothetical protein P4L55_05520 [Syntrophobacteraceae bacterium]|nr:hypothetical protein [Syntrophobacteraceae bacterium]